MKMDQYLDFHNWIKEKSQHTLRTGLGNRY